MSSLTFTQQVLVLLVWCSEWRRRDQDTTLINWAHSCNAETSLLREPLSSCYLILSVYMENLTCFQCSPVVDTASVTLEVLVHCIIIKPRRRTGPSFGFMPGQSVFAVPEHVSGLLSTLVHCISCILQSVQIAYKLMGLILWACDTNYQENIPSWTCVNLCPLFISRRHF